MVETSSTKLASHVTKRCTDAAGRTIEAINAASKTTTFEYDANGNRTKYRDPNSVGLDCTFDDLNRDISCTDTGSDTTEKTYNTAGLVVSQQDAKDNTTSYTYDVRGRNVKITDRLAGETEFTYDDNGNQLTLTDAEDSTTTYEYDDVNRKVKETYPDHVASTTPGDTGYGIREFTYNGAGFIVSQTDQLGDTVTHIYDLAGRRTNREYRTKVNSPSGTIADQDTFTYDDASRILTALKGRYSNTITFTYDDGGRIETEKATIDSTDYTITRTYDNTGQIETLTYPDGSIVDRNYTSRGRLDNVYYDVDGAGMIANAMVANLSYDNGNRESSRTHGNGLVTDRTYHSGENLVDEIDVVGYPLLSMDYTYDDNKNVTAETFDSTGAMDDYSFTAGYDDEDRLTSWDRSNGDDQDWTLSLVGDWDSFSENGGSAVSRTHNDVHEVTAIGANSLTNDVKGNLLTDTDSHTYTWDIDNHLATAAVGSMAARGIEGTHEYEYDALGRRVAKEVRDDSGMTTVVTRTLYINNYQLLPPLSSVGGQVVAEYEKVDTGSTTLARTYVYGEYVDEPLSITDYTDAGDTASGTAETLYYHTNRVFNVVGLTDNNDAVIEVYTYTPYGTVDIRDPSNMSSRASSSYGNTYTFTGRRTDQETGLHYFRARYMDSVLGKFIARDPIVYFSGYSLYAMYFAAHQGIDPSGMIGPQDPPLFPITVIKPVKPDKKKDVDVLYEELVKICKGRSCDTECSLEQCKNEARRIAIAIYRTYILNGKFDINKLAWRKGGSERVKGYYCYEWAYAFEDAFNLVATGKCFKAVVEAAYKHKSPKVHYWLALTSTCENSTSVYVDDGFMGGFPGLVHTSRPCHGSVLTDEEKLNLPTGYVHPSGYFYHPGYADNGMKRSECKPPKAYDDRPLLDFSPR